MQWQNTESVWFHWHEKLLHTARLELQGGQDLALLKLCMKGHWLWSFPVTDSQRQPHDADWDVGQHVAGLPQLAKLYRTVSLGCHHLFSDLHIVIGFVHSHLLEYICKNTITKQQWYYLRITSWHAMSGQPNWLTWLPKRKRAALHGASASCVSLL